MVCLIISKILEYRFSYALLSSVIRAQTYARVYGAWEAGYKTNPEESALRPKDGEVTFCPARWTHVVSLDAHTSVLAVSCGSLSYSGVLLCRIVVGKMLCLKIRINVHIVEVIISIKMRMYLTQVFSQLWTFATQEAGPPPRVWKVIIPKEM